MALYIHRESNWKIIEGSDLTKQEYVMLEPRDILVDIPRIYYITVQYIMQLYTCTLFDMCPHLI